MLIFRVAEGKKRVKCDGKFLRRQPGNVQRVAPDPDRREATFHKISMIFEFVL